MSYLYERFGSITLPTYNREHGMSPVAPQQRIVATVAGAFDGDGTARAAQQFPHNLTLEAVLAETSETAQRTALDALRAATGTRAYLYRRADNDDSVQRALCRLVALQVERSYKTRLAYQVLRCQFAQLAAWEGDNHASWELDDGSIFDDGLSFDAGDYYAVLASTAASQTVANGGNLPVTNVLVEITAGATALTSIIVSGTGFDLRWSGSLPAGQTLSIDCGAQSVLLSGIDAYSDFTLGDNHSIEPWCELAPGNTTIYLSVAGTVTGAAWAITFRDGWA